VVVRTRLVDLRVKERAARDVLRDLAPHLGGMSGVALSEALNEYVENKKKQIHEEENKCLKCGGFGFGCSCG
jgi:hypothetical protein